MSTPNTPSVTEDISVPSPAPAASDSSGSTAQVTPTETPAAPSDKQVETPEVTMDDFLAASNKLASLETKPADKPSDTPAPEIKTKTEPVVTDKRDYTDIDETLVPVFKKLHNDPFNTLKPIVKEYKTLKESVAAKDKQIAELSKKEQSFLEHPRGFALTPEFETVAEQATKAETIQRHWKAQFERVRSGENTYQEIDIDNQGNLVLSKPTVVDKTTEKYLEECIEFSVGQSMEKQSKLKSLAENHVTNYKASVTALRDFEKASFAVFEKPEAAKTLDPIVKDTIRTILPSAFHNNPLATGYAKALITIQHLGKMVAELQKSGAGATKAAVKEDIKKGGPTLSDMSGGGGKGSAPTEDVSFDDFKRVKEGV